MDILKKGSEVTYADFVVYKSNFRQGYAFLTSTTATKYLMRRNYSKPTGESEIYIFKNIEFKTPIVMYLRKGFPLLDKFNYFILQLQANGLIAKWISDSTFFTPQLILDDVKKFSINNLIGAFYLLFVGHIISIFALLCEIFTLKYTKINVKQ